jgi:hypothetical protein
MNGKYLDSIFAIVEYITESELSNTSKQLIIRYLEDTARLAHAERARLAIQRYTQNQIPTLDAIRKKSKTEELDTLDHLILKMEYQARGLDETEAK